MRRLAASARERLSLLGRDAVLTLPQLECVCPGGGWRELARERDLVRVVGGTEVVVYGAVIDALSGASPHALPRLAVGLPDLPPPDPDL